jgi:CRP-like cAMP-binding protein
MSTPTRRLPGDCEPPGPIACRSCDLNEVCRLVALEAGPKGQPTGALRTLQTGAPLFRAGAPAQSIYAIRQGMLKSVRVTEDGEERVLGTHTPGELLGLEGFGLRGYAYDAIALQPTVCCELPLRLFGEQSARVHALGTAFFRILSCATEPHSPLARGTVRQRVTAFLLDLSQTAGAARTEFPPLLRGLEPTGTRGSARYAHRNSQSYVPAAEPRAGDSCPRRLSHAPVTCARIPEADLGLICINTQTPLAP